MLYDYKTVEMELISNNPNWNIISDQFPYSTEMKECIQDPDWHGEGSVWTHLQMIRNYQRKLEINPTQLWSLMYHDIFKAKTRQIIDGHVSHPKHSSLGAQYAWSEMWENDIGTPYLRHQIYYIILWHQRVFHIWNNPNMFRATLNFQSNSCGVWPELIEFARADMLGRISNTATEGLDNIDLLVEWLDENDIHQLPRCNNDKIFYFEGENRNILIPAQIPKGSHVILMMGLPGSGKDSYLQKQFSNKNVVCLDDIRKTLKINMEDNQGLVIQTALEQARVYLRKGDSFSWNSTNLTHRNRDKIIKLFRDYDASVNVHAMSTPWPEILDRNIHRPKTKQVPRQVLDRMLWSWEPIDLTKVHRLTWV